MTMVERILREIEKRTNGYTENCIITMKYDNEEIELHPVGNHPGEYILVYGPHPWSSGTPEQVAEYLANYETYCKEYEEDKAKLQKYYEDEISQGRGDWDWYSDWHKDVYGYRPRFRNTMRGV